MVGDLEFRLHPDQTLEDHRVNLRVHPVPVDLFREHLVPEVVLEEYRTVLDFLHREDLELGDLMDLGMWPEQDPSPKESIFFGVLPIGSCSSLLSNSFLLFLIFLDRPVHRFLCLVYLGVAF